MPNEFGGPSSKASFLTGLLGSTVGAFKQEHDNKQAEDLKRKQVDYQLLMAAMEQLKPNLTPSQAGEIMTRATDIFKPKGHTDVKDRIKEVFGMDKPYEMQSAGIIRDAQAKPRAEVGLGDPDPNAVPSVIKSPYGDVTLPEPPAMQYEHTYGEQDLLDKERIIEAQTTKALAAQTHADELRRNARKEQNKAILDRYQEQSGIKERALAEREVRARAAQLSRDPDDPEVMDMARAQLQQEREQKNEIAKGKIEYNKQRITQIQENIKTSRERIKISAERLGRVKATNWNNDPQVKGAWNKVDEYQGLAGRLRAEASILHSKGDHEGAAVLDAKAEQAETAMQGVIDAIDSKVYQLNNPVTLPGPPSIGGTRRGGVMLTEAEILGAGGTKADVEDARRRGVLAQ